MITVEDIICKAFLTDKTPEEIGSTHTLNYYVLSLNDDYDLWWMFRWGAVLIDVPWNEYIAKEYKEAVEADQIEQRRKHYY